MHILVMEKNLVTINDGHEIEKWLLWTMIQMEAIICIDFCLFDMKETIWVIWTFIMNRVKPNNRSLESWNSYIQAN